MEKVFLRKVKSASQKKLPSVLSLFCGAGGLDVGFSQNGFRTFLAVDSLSAAVTTHKKNKLSEFSVCADIASFEALDIIKYLRESRRGLSSIGIIGGPPCQGFSRANSGRSQKDPRNLLAKRYIKIIEDLVKNVDVQFVVFENVAGIKDKKNVEVYTFIIKSLAKMGFNVSELDLMATSFHVPQKRRRVLVVAEKYNCDFSRVGLRVKGEVPIDGFISDLPDPLFYSRAGVSLDDIPHHPNHWTMKPRSNRFSTPPDEWKKTRSFKLLKWGEASPTIAFGNREIHIHPSGKRRLSIFEAMRLQGFPDSFQIMGNLSEQVEQISNAVPPPMAYEIAKIIKKGSFNYGR